jgi:LmbE family N-acetylglucosaminyl deacetylase
MLQLGFEGHAPVRRVLAVGAHSDDLEIGCGGTILALTRAHPDVTVHWVVLAAPGARGDEARRGAEVVLADAATAAVEIHSFRDGYLPHTAAEVKDTFEDLKARVEPELVLTHTRDDLHPDHRLVCELTWNTFRDHLVLEYEIPKVDGDLGTPNVFVPLPQPLCSQKVEALERHFGTQRGKRWFSEDTFWSLLRLRGLECQSPTRYAEAFYSRKLVL